MTPHCDDDIKRDEGLRLRAYQDTLGIWTIGYGHAGIEPHAVWTQAQADAQFADDAGQARAGLDKLLPWWTTLDDARQDVLVNMAFQLGARGVLAFRDALQDMHAGQWVSASHAMLSSLWARQTPTRAKRLAEQMRTGVRA